MLTTGWDIINLPDFADFSQNNALIFMNIHEYANELICIF